MINSHIVDPDTGEVVAALETTVKNQFNALPDPGQTGFGKSKTVPEQTLSLKELVRRHQTGQLVETRSPVYDDADEQLDLSRMDKVQLAVHTQEVLADVAQAQRRVALAKEAKKLLEQQQKEAQKETQKTAASQQQTTEKPLSEKDADF